MVMVLQWSRSSEVSSPVEVEELERVAVKWWAKVVLERHLVK